LIVSESKQEMAQIINKTVVYGRILLPFLVVAAALAHAQAPSVPQPDRERLLNGLTILYGNRPGDPNLLLKLRIQSGAAFDLAGKAGTMALLADAMFPESTTREYVTDQLGGRLDVSAGYDAIDVTISGKTTDLERMIQLLRDALVNLNLSPENVATQRSARIKELTEKSSMSDAANRAVAARLFGTYPYAHPAEGSVETVAKIERGDLMLARDRFLNADNAALVVIGGVDKARLMRTVRQLLGPWQKGDRIVPATFRQPGAVDDRVLVIDQSGASNAEIRLAVRGLSRSDPDAMAAFLLCQVANQRWRAAVPEISKSSFVRHESHALSGMFVFGATAPAAFAAKAVAAAKKIMTALAESGPSEAEMPTLVTMSNGLTPVDSLASTWLDAETYKLPLNKSSDASRISPADLRRAAARLFGNSAPQAIVVVGNAAELKPQFGDQAELPASLTNPGSNSPLPLKKP
jgi:predicted Zn-dependent peptidase